MILRLLLGVVSNTGRLVVMVTGAVDWRLVEEDRVKDGDLVVIDGDEVGTLVVIDGDEVGNLVVINGDEDKLL